jgi:transposase
MKPGSSVSIVARRHDINANLVSSWRKVYQEGRLGVKAGEQSFIPVGVVGSQASVPAPVTAPGMTGLIELTLPGGIILRVDNRIEEPVLRRALRGVWRPCLLRSLKPLPPMCETAEHYMSTIAYGFFRNLK